MDVLLLLLLLLSFVQLLSLLVSTPESFEAILIAAPPIRSLTNFTDCAIQLIFHEIHSLFSIRIIRTMNKCVEFETKL